MNEPKTQNKHGEWVTAIPEPYHHFIRKECYFDCGKKFFTEESYRAHYALVHILGL